MAMTGRITSLIMRNRMTAPRSNLPADRATLPVLQVQASALVSVLLPVLDFPGMKLRVLRIHVRHHRFPRARVRARAWLLRLARN